MAGPGDHARPHERDQWRLATFLYQLREIPSRDQVTLVRARKIMLAREHRAKPVQRLPKRLRAATLVCLAQGLNLNTDGLPERSRALFSD